MKLANQVLNENEDLVAEIEVEYRRQFDTEHLGSVVVTDQRIIFLYRSENSWNRFETYQLSSEPFAQYHHKKLKSVFIPEPDIDQVSQILRYAFQSPAQWLSSRSCTRRRRRSRHLPRLWRDDVSSITTESSSPFLPRL